MKRAVAATVIFSVILLCSCSAVKEPEQICVNRIFSAIAEIRYQGTAFTADFTCDEDGCSAVFSSPEEIKGLKISSDGNRAFYSLDSLSFDSEGTNHQTQLISAVYSAISAAGQTATATEEGYILHGNTKFGEYILNINADSLTPSFIEYREQDITVRFSQIS